METALLKKKTSKKPARKKSRTSNRPAQNRRALFENHLGSKIVFRAGYVLCVFVLIYFLFAQLAHLFFEVAPPISSVYAQVKKLTLPSRSVGLPVRLKIPTIKVDADIRYVGRAKDGSMGVPKLPRETAWYALGVKPGDVGNAVIAGHVDWWYGAIGVFKNLHTLKPGDIITVQDEKGVSTSFVVRETKEYTGNDDTTEVFVTYDGKSHLNLVTCSGLWNKITKKYTKRLVVFTDKIVK